METYKKPVVVSKTGKTMIISLHSSAKFTAMPPDDNLQKMNSRALTPRKDITK